MNTRNPFYSFVFAALAVGALGTSVSVAQESIRARELTAALAVSQTQVGQLRDELVRSEAQRKALVAKLAGAVQVSEEQLAQSRETQLKLQAFGVDLFTQDEKSIQQRLLKAVRDLDIAEQELDRRKIVIRELSETFLSFLNETDGVDQEKKVKALAAIDRAGDALTPLADDKEYAEPLTSLDGSEIVSLDPEIGLVVIDAGRASGLRVGTPIAIMKEGQPIFSAMVVDVRDTIAGAVLQNQLAENMEAAVGDGIQLLPNQPNL